MTEKTKDWTSSIASDAITITISMLVVLGVISIARYFLKTSESPACSTSNLELCINEVSCKEQNLHWWNNSCNLVSEPIVIPPSQYPDYDSVMSTSTEASSTYKLFKIIDQPFTSWTPEKAKQEDKMFNITIKRTGGQLSAAYLHIKVSRGDKPFTAFDSIYLLFNDVGGHLFRSQSLPVPPGDKTELLYAMNYVPYLKSIPYSESRTPSAVNWFDIFNGSNNITVDSFISSLHESEIEEMSIYYQCTKDEECSLSK